MCIGDTDRLSGCTQPNPAALVELHTHGYVSGAWFPSLQQSWLRVWHGHFKDHEMIDLKVVPFHVCCREGILLFDQYQNQQNRDIREVRKN